MVRAVRPVAAIALAIGIVYAATQTSSAAVRPPKLQYEITTLPNGLTLILSEDHSTPIVHLQLWYHVGSKNEKAGPHRLRASVRASDVQGLEERSSPRRTRR